MWGPAAVFPPRLTRSVLPGAGLFYFGRLGATLRKDWRAIRRDYCPQPLPDEDPRKLRRPSFGYFISSSSIISPKLAEILAEMLNLGNNAHRHIVMECNPGPGVLTKALLETGASVIALESHKKFIPHLKSLGEKLNGRLEVVHCDFFKMDPSNHNLVRPPVVLSQELFPSLGIKANSWLEDTPFKVVGMLPVKNERKALWKLLHDMYTCSSIYRYGRVELYMFISESQFEKLIAGPTNPYLYHVLSVLWQVSCEIKLLYKAPSSLFDMYNKNGQLVRKASVIHQNLCFIQMTPRKDLFTKYLTPLNYDIFFHMVKQCFGRRSALLIQHLHSLTPYDPLTIMNKAEIKSEVKPSDIYPQDFKHLFETIECSSDDDSKWLYDRVIEDLHC
ncbi:dimethyladenosine transferase 2, mitochondrial isoform X1 [Octodon degus]|uniref:rRNA adenine N(6)-methyltransferase n=1 Tax=Octodon degus TaxID=10160 RepID=A0A6P6E1R5_OCTDE|nr:dimethyladenosine transferase 2, mitochondrial isoform X1 [Octodon degus]